MPTTDHISWILLEHNFILGQVKSIWYKNKVKFISIVDKLVLKHILLNQDYYMYIPLEARFDQEQIKPFFLINFHLPSVY